MAITTKNGAVVADEQMEAMAAMFERGEWPEGRSRVVRGRPLLFGEELKAISFKVSARKVSALDGKAAAAGMSRSDYLRELVDKDLTSA